MKQIDAIKPCKLSILQLLAETQQAWGRRQYPDTLPYYGLKGNVMKQRKWIMKGILPKQSARLCAKCVDASKTAIN